MLAKLPGVGDELEAKGLVAAMRKVDWDRFFPPGNETWLLRAQTWSQVRDAFGLLKRVERFLSGKVSAG